MLSKRKSLALSVLSALALAGSLPAAQASTHTFSNSSSITIPGVGTFGPANPYPSEITVSGLTGTITKLTATLNGLTHTFPDDLDMLLVGPGGQNVLIMSDAGDSDDIRDVNLTFDDDAASSLPDSTQISSGTYKPTNYGSGDAFDLPAPQDPYGSTMSVFNGQDPNGVYKLFIMDDAQADAGSLSGGWSLTLTTNDQIPGPSVPEPGSVAMLCGMGLTGVGFLSRRIRRKK
ncbi:MAG TPA: PEP-CTERM sorting domain-containing protein [Chthonomonadaceae bacterium]|nr:PEP-CTERM sorting domain-containing protein [Chthonomonadaceae bacterium]